jgi:hypothetical protein
VEFSLRQTILLFLIYAIIGDLSQAQKEALHRLNCHSSGIAEAFYTKLHHRDTLAAGRAAFALLTRTNSEEEGGSSTVISAGGGVGADADGGSRGGADAGAVAPVVLPRRPQYAATSSAGARGSSRNSADADEAAPHLALPSRPKYGVTAGTVTGSNHPDLEKGPRERASWTRAEVDYVGAFVTKDEMLHPGRGNIVARCRKAILKDPSARAIFHPNHIVDSGRLRTGYEKYLKSKRELAVDDTARHGIDDAAVEELFLNFDGDIFDI